MPHHLTRLFSGLCELEEFFKKDGSTMPASSTFFEKVRPYMTDLFTTIKQTASVKAAFEAGHIASTANCEEAWYEYSQDCIERRRAVDMRGYTLHAISFLSPEGNAYNTTGIDFSNLEPWHLELMEAITEEMREHLAAPNPADVFKSVRLAAWRAKPVPLPVTPSGKINLADILGDIL